MIRYALVCEHDHAFEGWFAASADFDDQQRPRPDRMPGLRLERGAQADHGPGRRRGRRRGASAEATHRCAPMMMEAMGRVRSHVDETFDDVGDAFATEARAIHEGRSEDRGIYGEATPKEVRDLVEDGVPVAPLPPEPPKKTELN